MKRVQFASTSLVYSSSPEPPSPTLSFTSIPSSSSPDIPTPPPELRPDHDVTLYPECYSDETTSVYNSGKSAQIHFLLAYSPTQQPPVPFDITQPPFQAPSHLFYEPATSPPLRHLIIIHPLLPWELSVRPSNGTYVSVQDVFNALYLDLSRPITRTEYDSLESTLGGSLTRRRKVDMAYFARCGDREEERMAGVKRVDCLMGQTRFCGLLGIGEVWDVWELCVD